MKAEPNNEIKSLSPLVVLSPITPFLGFPPGNLISK